MSEIHEPQLEVLQLYPSYREYLQGLSKSWSVASNLLRVFDRDRGESNLNPEAEKVPRLLIVNGGNGTSRIHLYHLHDPTSIKALQNSSQERGTNVVCVQIPAEAPLPVEPLEKVGEIFNVSPVFFWRILNDYQFGYKKNQSQVYSFLDESCIPQPRKLNRSEYERQSGDEEIDFQIGINRYDNFSGFLRRRRSLPAATEKDSTILIIARQHDTTPDVMLEPPAFIQNISNPLSRRGDVETLNMAQKLASEISLLNSEEIQAMHQDPVEFILLSAWILAENLTHKLAFWQVDHRQFLRRFHESYPYATGIERDRLRSQWRLLYDTSRYLSTSVRTLNILAEKFRSSAPKTTLEKLTILTFDYEELQQHVDQIKDSYHEFLSQQVTRIALEESERSLSVDEGVQRLTYLGFVFAPISLVTSIFSMQIVEFGSGKLSLWVFFVTVVGVIVVLLCAWAYLRRKSILAEAARKRSRSGRYSDRNVILEARRGLAALGASIDSVADSRSRSTSVDRHIVHDEATRNSDLLERESGPSPVPSRSESSPAGVNRRQIQPPNFPEGVTEDNI